MASAVSKAFKIMWLLRRSPAPLSLTEVARAVGVAPSTAHSILNGLSSEGAVVSNEERRYSLGPATFYLGASYARSVPVHSRTWSDLIRLADDVDLTAVALVVWADHYLILDVHQNDHPGLEVAFGGRVPLDAGAWGKAYYAWRCEAPESLTKYTANTIVEAEAYEHDLEIARERGYATDHEEFLIGAGAVASVVTSDKGLEGVLALVGAVGTVDESQFQEAGQRLAGLATNISYALGDARRVTIVGRD